MFHCIIFLNFNITLCMALIPVYVTQGTDDTMLKKLHKEHHKNPHYIKPKSEAQRAFGIHHFAGFVWYQAEDMLEKNRDTFSADLFDLLHMSKSPFLLSLFTGEKAMVNVMMQ